MRTDKGGAYEALSEAESCREQQRASLLKQIEAGENPRPLSLVGEKMAMLVNVQYHHDLLFHVNADQDRSVRVRFEVSWTGRSIHWRAV